MAKIKNFKIPALIACLLCLQAFYCLGCGLNISAPKQVCSGDTIYLSVSGGTGPYVWRVSFDTSWSDTGQSIINVQSVKTTASITFYAADLGGSGCHDSATIKINPLPLADPGQAWYLFKGGIYPYTQIGDSAVVGNTYSWVSNPEGFTSTLSAPIVGPSVTTIYTLTETIVVTGCHNMHSCQIIPIAIADINDNNDTSISFDIIYSPYIFEGKVLNAIGFRSPYSDSIIYTSSIVHITRVFKGDINCGDIEIVNIGGWYGNNFLWVEGALSLYPGQEGIFMCNITGRPSLQTTKENPYPYMPFNEQESFLEYDTLHYFNNTDTVKYYDYGLMQGYSPHAIYELLVNQTGHYPQLCYKDTFNDPLIATNSNPSSFTNAQNAVVLSGINQNTAAIEGNLKIYPNPAISTLKIESITNPIQSITVFDITGKEVYDIANLKAQNQSIPVGNFPSGIYIVKLETDNGSYMAKFMKM